MTRSALETRSSRPPASRNTSEPAIAAEDVTPPRLQSVLQRGAVASVGEVWHPVCSDDRPVGWALGARGPIAGGMSRATLALCLAVLAAPVARADTGGTSAPAQPAIAAADTGSAPAPDPGTTPPPPATTPPAPPPAKRLGDRLPLRRGMRGADVKALQRLLARTGRSLGMDGDFGPATAAALRDWERAGRRRADGVLSAADLLALRGDAAKGP